MPGTTVTREDHSFVDDYGVTIHYYVWRPAAPTAIAQIVHGLGEYATRYEPLIQQLVADGYVVYTDDHRGHGKTGLEQWGGDHSKLGHLGKGGVRATAKEIHDLTVRARSDNPGLPLVAIGQSLGSLFLQMILNDHAADYDAVVMTGTAYRTYFQMNSGDLNKRHRHLGTTGHEWLSRDVAVHEAFAADPLTFDAKAAKLFGLIDGARLLGRPKKLARDVPIHIVIGSEDPLGGPRSVELLAKAYRTRGGLSDVSVVVYPEGRHEVFNETNRAEVVTEVLAWIDRHLPSRR